MAPFSPTSSHLAPLAGRIGNDAFGERHLRAAYHDTVVKNMGHIRMQVVLFEPCTSNT
jgi:hypothetical protein